MSNSIPISKEIFDRMMLYQETLKPDKDVQYIVEQYRTGRFCPRPFIYKNYFYGSAMGKYFATITLPYSFLITKDNDSIYRSVIWSSLGRVFKSLQITCAAAY